MFAFKNINNSCYIDSLLVALFLPDFEGFFDNLFLRENTPLQNVLRQHVTTLRDHTADAPWMCLDFIHLCGANREQHSVIDFFRFLLHACNVADTICTYQTSTTLMKTRPETLEARNNIKELVQLWIKTPIVHVWNFDNAHEVADEAERNAILSDSTHSSFLIENALGDRRRINPPENTATFLCQISAEDTQPVHIARQIMPHLDVISSETYAGDVAVKIIATKLIDAPLLIFEVARVIGSSRETSAGLVNFGHEHRNEWLLRVHGRNYRLVAVVCHLGFGNGGHYVTYAKHPDNTWKFYDDITGELVAVDAPLHHARPSPARHGELFFYIATP